MSTGSRSQGSVTQWIEDLRNKDPDATREIWNRFVQQLVRVANRILTNSKCCVSDGEDVVACAFHDFFRRNPDDFGKLVNRNDLWQILVVITERRAIDAIRNETAARRGGPFASVDSLNYLPGRENAPDIELMLIEEFEKRLELLNSDLLREIAINRMNGMKNHEIAELVDVPLRSVERKVKDIKETWRDR